MQISCTIPSNLNNITGYQISRATSSYRGRSPLNPTSVVTATPPHFCLPRIVSCSAAVTTTKTKTSLSNLEKLLLDNNVPTPAEVAAAATTTTATTDVGRKESKGKGNIFEGLSLGGIWPGTKKTVEEMSPRKLNRLRRLLSRSYQEHSPRDYIADRWREYHGSHDWVGLLDPLDPNLRREVIRYGEFVQAAYKTFHSNPTKETESVNDVSLRDKSYKVTKGLYATSSTGLPKWVDDVAPNLGWLTQRSSWVGFVAVCDDKKEINRMGRRDIVIALRGTSTCQEWAENLRASLVPILGEENTENGPKVECGFSSLFATPGEHVPSLAESVVQEVRRLMDLYRGETLSISITGHSLGAALAVLVADELSRSVFSDSMESAPSVAVFSFGGPKVGNQAFADQINSNKVKVLRIVNEQDVITRVPGMFIGEMLRDNLKSKTPHLAHGVLEALDNNMVSNAYTHVGAELRLDTRMSPYLKPNADVACCHDLEAYLHLVDGFIASDSPYRANAKRSLLKLLSEQGANVKKLYMSRAKSSLMKAKANFDLEGAMPLMRAPSFNECVG
ncbi:hypothetical protein Droror1_Dr00027118 [Drosera rotundifolia]